MHIVIIKKLNKNGSQENVYLKPANTAMPGDISTFHSIIYNHVVHLIASDYLNVNSMYEFQSMTFKNGSYGVVIDTN
jgi:hypothetical protein